VGAAKAKATDVLDSLWNGGKFVWCVGRDRRVEHTEGDKLPSGELAVDKTFCSSYLIATPRADTCVHSRDNESHRFRTIARLSNGLDLGGEGECVWCPSYTRHSADRLSRTTLRNRLSRRDVVLNKSVRVRSVTRTRRRVWSFFCFLKKEIRSHYDRYGTLHASLVFSIISRRPFVRTFTYLRETAACGFGPDENGRL